MMRIGKTKKREIHMTCCQFCQGYYEKYPLQQTDDNPYNKWVHVIEEGIEQAPIECAFQDNIFDNDNWNCQTMMALRERVDYTDRNTDVSIGIIRIPKQEGHIVMLWYKNRGRTSNAYVMCEDEEPKILTYDVAVSVLIEIGKH